MLHTSNALKVGNLISEEAKKVRKRCKEVKEISRKL
jgi:hypothetical protein